MTCYNFLTHFFQLERKVTPQIVWYGKHEKIFISHTEEAEARDVFRRGWESDTILHFLKVEVLLPIYQNQSNT